MKDKILLSIGRGENCRIEQEPRAPLARAIRRSSDEERDRSSRSLAILGTPRAGAPGKSPDREETRGKSAS
jgi:hypothetical protein